MFKKLAETIQRLGYCSGLGKSYLFLGGTVFKANERSPGEISRGEAEEVQ